MDPKEADRSGERIAIRQIIDGGWGAFKIALPGEIPGVLRQRQRRHNRVFSQGTSEVGTVINRESKK